MTDDGAVIDRMYAALSRGDIPAALDCLAENARLWHNFDGIAHGKADMSAQWQALIDNFPQRDFVDVRRQPTPDGFVHQQVMAATTASGARKAWPCCLLVRVESGLITRLDEYIDRAGAFEWAEGAPVVAPGLS